MDEKPPPNARAFSAVREIKRTTKSAQEEQERKKKAIQHKGL